MRGHVVRDVDVPTGQDNYMMLDPAGRNFFMLYVRRAGGKAWVYREWPGSYHIPGVGVPDPWAVPSSRNPSKGNDGDRGGAQTSWGFSLLRYKFEIARLERWRNWVEWSRGGAGPDEVPDWGEIEGWHEEDGAEENIVCRYVDARPATAPKIENDRVTTLHTDLNNLGMWWVLSPANLINDDVVKIQSALEMGTLMIAEGCRNLRWALSNWTGADGEKGACKDPIDTLRWFFGAGLAEGIEKMDGDGDAPASRRAVGRPTRERTGMMRQPGESKLRRREAPGRGPRVRWRAR